MSDYISREGLKEEMAKLLQLYIDENNAVYAEGLSSAYALICSMPAADVVERKYGKWCKRYYFRASTNMYDCEMKVCSECGSEWSYDSETGVGDYNFCPNCGARMVEHGEKEDANGIIKD